MKKTSPARRPICISQSVAGFGGSLAAIKEKQLITGQLNLCDTAIQTQYEGRKCEDRWSIDIFNSSPAYCDLGREAAHAA
jgi:hypothetical protein